MDQTVSLRSLDQATHTSALAQSGGESTLGQFTSHAVASLEYNLVQAPVSAVTQIVDHEAGTNFLPKVQMFDAPKKSEVGTAAWAGDVAGGTAAAAIPFIVFHRMVGPGAAAALETSANYGVKAAMPALAKTALLGTVYGGLLTPTSGDKDNFWKERGQNALVSALALTTMTAGSIGLKATGKSFLAGDLTSSAISGAAAGEIDADGHSLLAGKGLASNKERFASIATWSLGSAMGGAANTAHEYFAPTSGIRGVRTLGDMTRLADTTVKPGHPERYAFEGQQANPVKAEMLSDDALHEWYNRSSLNLRHEIDNSNMPTDWKKQIVSGHQDFTYALDALANRPNPKPIGVVYGSARFKENDFRYQRARYIGGRMVQEGYDVMTGGGPGTMEAANRGAYEADGTSVGVVLKLPHEKRGNGYQTLTLKHRNFYTRMENLKKADFFIVEDGGIGTGAEALDTLTHIQCGKLKEVPVYFVGKKNYALMDNWLNAMEKAGTISPSDRKLYRIVDNPDEIFADLQKRKADATATTAQKSAADLAAGQGDKAKPNAT
jgi:uncharacterized protein (TIGR00730 family)